MKLVEVIWVDAVIEEAHLLAEAIHQLTPLERHSVGYVVEEDDECIRITFGTIENFYKGQVAYEMGVVIPHCMIKEVKQLRVNPL